MRCGGFGREIQPALDSSLLGRSFLPHHRLYGYQPGEANRELVNVNESGYSHEALTGTRSSAMTAQAPASSAILACSALTTSIITPP